MNDRLWVGSRHRSDRAANGGFASSLKKCCRSAIDPFAVRFEMFMVLPPDVSAWSTIVMLRPRLMILALACAASACSIFAAVLLNEGLRRSGDVLVDWIVTRWSSQEIEAAMEYALPASMVLISLSLILIFISPITANMRPMGAKAEAPSSPREHRAQV